MLPTVGWCFLSSYSLIPCSIIILFICLYNWCVVHFPPHCLLNVVLLTYYTHRGLFSFMTPYPYTHMTHLIIHPSFHFFFSFLSSRYRICYPRSYHRSSCHSWKSWIFLSFVCHSCYRLGGKVVVEKHKIHATFPPSPPSCVPSWWSDCGRKYSSLPPLPPLLCCVHLFSCDGEIVVVNNRGLGLFWVQFWKWLQKRFYGVFVCLFSCVTY